MEIRRRLSLQFLLIAAMILFAAEVSIYIFCNILWKENFLERLQNKTSSVAEILTEMKGSGTNLISLLERGSDTYLPFEETRIYNFTKELVFASRQNMKFPVPNSFIDQVKIDGRSTMEWGQYRINGLAYKGKFDRLIVVTGAIDVYGLKKLYTLRVILLAVFIFSMIVAFFTGRIFTNKALEPILKVIEQVPAINEQNLHLRVDEGNGKDEVARLARTFNQMLERLENAFKVQRTFIANASHELRTPLAYIMGQLEISLMKERSTEEYKEALVSVFDDVKNMNETTNRLLLLAIANFDTANIPFTELRIDEVLWDARKIVTKSNSGYSVNISFSEPDEDERKLKVMANEQLLKVAFVNLFDNGCKYSDNNSVDVTLVCKPENLVITITDKGIGIPEDQVNLVFEPFFRGGNTSGRKGHGLGLSMVLKIIHQHGGTIGLRSKIGEGTEFTVTLPYMN